MKSLTLYPLWSFLIMSLITEKSNSLDLSAPILIFRENVRNEKYLQLNYLQKNVCYGHSSQCHNHLMASKILQKIPSFKI